MNKKVLPFALFLLLPCLLLAYPVTIDGIVANGSDKGVAGIEVSVHSAANDPFAYKNTLITDDHGSFTITIEVPDDVEKGTLLFSVVNCSSVNHTKRVVYGPNHPQHTIRLQTCQDHPTTCDVKIQIRENDAGEIILTAKTRPDGEYQYEWSTGETTSEIIALDKIEYCVTVTSGPDCKARACVNLRQDGHCKSEILITRPDTDPATFVLSVRSKGQAPFTYFWSTEETTEQIKVTEAGEYCVRVVDALGCTSGACVILGGTDCDTKIQVVRVAPNADHYSVKLFARTKGRAPFTYLWNTGATTQMLEVMEPGEYCVEVTDATGCVSDGCVVLDPSRDCKTEIALTPNHDANSLSTSLKLTARTHGRAPFKYRWSTGDTTKMITVTDIKEYCVEVIDANGCVSDDCLDLSVLADSCSVTIHRTANGNLIAQPRGLPPFKIEWSTGATGRVTRISGPGEYCVTVTGLFGCVAEACVIIDDATDQCKVKIHRKPLDNIGSIELVAQVKGKGDFHFEWSTGETTKSIIVETSGIYWVIASNDHCAARDQIKIELGTGVSVGDAGIVFPQTTNNPSTFAALSASPNPTAGDLRVRWESSIGDEPSQMVITSARGEIMSQQQIFSTKGLNDFLLATSELTPGFYFVQLKTAKRTSIVKFLKH